MPSLATKLGTNQWVVTTVSTHKAKPFTPLPPSHFDGRFFINKKSASTCLPKSHKFLLVEPKEGRQDQEDDSQNDLDSAKDPKADSVHDQILPEACWCQESLHEEEDPQRNASHDDEDCLNDEFRAKSGERSLPVSYALLTLLYRGRVGIIPIHASLLEVG